MSREFRLPDLGEGIHEGQIMRVLVAEGDLVAEDQPLLEVETDKARVEIPSPMSGVVRRIHVQEQAMANVGDVLFTFGPGADETDAEVPVTRETAASPKGGPVTIPPSLPGSAPARQPASPAVRRLARELGVALTEVDGSGRGGRITRQDVEHAASAVTATPTGPATLASPLVPATDAVRGVPVTLSPLDVPDGIEGTDAWGAIVRQDMSRARHTIAHVMSESWRTIPHVTDTDEADVTALDELRRGWRDPERPDRTLTMLPFVLRAVVRALQRYPLFNASIDEEKGQVVYHRYINVSVGVQTERGLIAPVIRNADTLTIPAMADTLETTSVNARSAAFTVNDMRGGTYTVSNIGSMGGSRFSTPIITPPQVAVLAIGRMRRRPWVVDDAIIPRLVMPLSHSIDHRLIDGGHEVPFLRHIVEDLEQPARLLLG